MKLLCVVLASLLVHCGNASDEATRKIETTKLSPEEIAVYSRNAKYSKPCYNALKPISKQLGVTLKERDPHVLNAGTYGYKDCICNVTGHSTMMVKDSIKAAIIPSITVSKEDVGVFYDLKVGFDHVEFDCNFCELKTPSGEIITGSYSSIWPHPVIEVVAYKRIWFGKYVIFQSVKEVGAIRPSDLTLNCFGSEEFKKLCKQLHADKKLDMQLEKYIIGIIPKALTEEEEKALYHTHKDVINIFALFSCHPESVLDSEEYECTDPSC